MARVICYCSLFQLFIISIAWGAEDQLPINSLKYELLKSYDFSNSVQMEDWEIEGPGSFAISSSQMLLVSDYQQRLISLLKPEQIWQGNGTQETLFRETLLPLIAENNPEYLQNYIKGTPIRYGNIVLWNKLSLPSNYAIEYDFQSASPYPLHMLLFSAMGINEQSIFSTRLPKRNGIANQYMNSDLSNYRISYFSGKRATINMRKSPGRHLIASIPELPSLIMGEKYKIKLIKFNQHIHFYINDALIIDYIDTNPLLGGHWGFRLMLFAKSYYDNIKIYSLKN
ncbi:DUF1961 family protein [Thalassotalea sp. SU-HH00458]|uniref:DUF1961 family protein n=1 Tax=Thalassotalea sp. SU-HH00458 TaxID=3127657 RepID=UPI003101CB47